MATRAPYRIQARTVSADRAVLASVVGLSDFTPANAQYTTDAVRQLEASLIEAQLTEDRAMRDLEVARQELSARVWAFHEAVKGLKAQVLAQYGDDSVALHALGLKTRSERKRPTRRKTGVE